MIVSRAFNEARTPKADERQLTPRLSHDHCMALPDDRLDQPGDLLLVMMV
ncbi:MAG: hypothetical protein H6976_16570 [Gammaproteobacteria bacterium]|nr:hypothetical protein [Gammaproteobacteria bacterium]